MARPRVVYVLNNASETSIPLEIAAALGESTDVDVHVCSFFEPADETFGVDVHSLGASSQLDPRAYLRLVKFVRRIDPDVIHVHPNATGSVSRVLLSMCGVSLVTTEHNDHNHFGWAKLLINGSTNPLNDVLVANSMATKDSLAGWERMVMEATGTETRVIHNGIDIPAIEESGANEWTPSLPSGFLIGTASRLVSQKNHSALLRAVAPIISENDAQLVIIGEGPREEDLKRLASELGIDHGTHFLGYLPERTDVYSVMRQLDLFSFHSKYEGFGVAVAEAMALGTPVIANDIPVLREVVDGAGRLVDVDDTDAFTDVIYELRRDAQLRSKLGEAGANRVRNRFPHSRTIKLHSELYRELSKDD